jgi:hypothetical protein
MKDRYPVNRRRPVAIATCVACCLAQAALAAPAALTDAALDKVTAGDPPEQPATGKPPIVVVADGAHYTFHGNQNVRMEGTAQADANALNLVAAAGSDVGTALNVLSIGSDVSGVVAQQNSFAQIERQTGALGRATLDGTHTTHRSTIESAFASGSSSSRVTGRRLRDTSSTTTVTQSALFVPEFTPLQDLTLDVGTPALPPLHIPGFGIDLVEDTDAGDFGIRGSVGPFTLEPPQVVLGTVSLDGDDVVLSSGFVQLPGLDLGSATLDVCFIDCAGASVDLGSFPSQRVDFPGGDLRFEGANPFKDLHINAGHGIAVAGTGSINVTPSHIEVSAELTLDLPDPTFSFDFSIPGISFGDLGSIGPFDIDGPDVEIEIPPVSVSHTLFDQDVGFAYSAQFDGVLCLSFTTNECGTASHETQHSESHVDERIDEATASSFASGGRSVSDVVDVHAGATLTDAEADLIAMSAASALIDATNSIALEDAAQRGIRVLNAVNAADSIAGNALNVAAVRPPQTAAGLAPSVGQSNVFVQYRTRYGL